MLSASVDATNFCTAVVLSPWPTPPHQWCQLNSPAGLLCSLHVISSVPLRHVVNTLTCHTSKEMEEGRKEEEERGGRRGEERGGRSEEGEEKSKSKTGLNGRTESGQKSRPAAILRRHWSLTHSAEKAAFCIDAASST